MPTNHYFNESMEQQPPQQPTCSRRTFLRQLLTVGTVGLIMPGLLTACGAPAAETTATATPATALEADAVADTAATSCQAETDLTAQDQQTRQSLAYSDHSPRADQSCRNCRFYQKSTTNAACGGCQILRGAVAADGHCNAWIAS